MRPRVELRPAPAPPGNSPAWIEERAAGYGSQGDRSTSADIVGNFTFGPAALSRVRGEGEQEQHEPDAPEIQHGHRRPLHQGRALAAFVRAKELGVDVAPSGTRATASTTSSTASRRACAPEADAATRARLDRPVLRRRRPHRAKDRRPVRRLQRLLHDRRRRLHCQAGRRGRSATSSPRTRSTRARHCGCRGSIARLDIADRIEAIARTCLFAVQEAGRIYRHIEAAKGREVRARGVDGRDRPAADAGRVAVHPRGDRAGRDPGADDRRSSPASSTRASTTSATSASSSTSSTTTSP